MLKNRKMGNKSYYRDPRRMIVRNRIIKINQIMPLPNGPYYLLNDMESKVVDNLQNSNGESLSTMVGIALCCCGACNNKPFCDGTHSIIGFSSNNLCDGGKDKRRRNYIGKNIFMIIGQFAPMLNTVSKTCQRFSN